MRRVAMVLAGAGLVAAASPIAAQPAAERRIVPIRAEILDISPRIVSLAEEPEPAPAAENRPRRRSARRTDRAAPTAGDRAQFTLASEVLFAQGEAELSARARGALDRIATRLLRRGPGTVAIVGHTDAQGSATFNRRLSQRRAEAVERYLARGGRLREFALFSRGVGESEPLASNATPSGRARNRRVTISFSADS